jgi:hypothetical protein
VPIATIVVGAGLLSDMDEGAIDVSVGTRLFTSIASSPDMEPDSNLINWVPEVSNVRSSNKALPFAKNLVTVPPSVAEVNTLAVTAEL